MNGKHETEKRWITTRKIQSYIIMSMKKSYLMTQHTGVIIFVFHKVLLKIIVTSPSWRNRYSPCGSMISAKSFIDANWPAIPTVPFVWVTPEGSERERERQQSVTILQGIMCCMLLNTSNLDSHMCDISRIINTFRRRFSRNCQHLIWRVSTVYL